jgi:hypothetical protein
MTTTHILQPMFLNQFIGQIQELNPDKLFYGPRDIFGMARSKMTLDELIHALHEYYNYWMDEIGEETLFYIPLEWSDGYCISMKNSEIDGFKPFGPLD